MKFSLVYNCSILAGVALVAAGVAMLHGVCNPPAYACGLWADTAKDLGFGVVSSSPYGLVGPKGMDPAVVKTLHDAFKKAMDDPKHLALLDELNQDLWYRSGEDYAKWAAETYAKDKVLIERLGLAAK